LLVPAETVAVAGEESMGIASPRKGFISHMPAARWEEGLISGNGRMGVIVAGHPLQERVIVSHERLFLPMHERRTPVDTASHLQEIRSMLKAGEYRHATRFVVELSHEEGYEDMMFTDPFFPACDLTICAQPRGRIRNYARSLDFQTGVASVGWQDDRGEFLRRVFVSRPDNAIVLSYSGSERGSVACELELIQHPGITPEFARCIAHVRTGAEAGWLIYESSYTLTGGGYLVAARVVPRGGSANAVGEKVVVRDADELLVLMRVVPLDRFDAACLGELREDLRNLDADFERLLAPHADAHGRIFGRVSLDLGGGDDRNHPAEELVDRARQANLLPAALEKMFDAGRYAILSSCGELPPNLQGVWAGDWGAAWSGDYTLNGNVQSAISCLLSCGMEESLHSFFGYIESLLPDFRVNARRLYGCSGILLPSRASTHGLNNHFNETFPQTFWTAGGAWAAQFYYDYWLYTGDRSFLINHALPFMKEVAFFYQDFLIEDETGKYCFSPSYSPENHPRNSDSQACVNATMDIGAARELFTNLIDACNEIGVDQEAIPRWRGMLEKMPPYLVNEDGAVREWAHPGLEDRYHHRHCSHLYPLFGGIPPDLVNCPDLQNAFRRAIELRAAERRRHTDSELMAFGLAQMGLAASSLGDSATVSFVIDMLASHYYFRNFASSHDPQRIFNTDCSGGLPAVIAKALVQSRPGGIELLPAVPDQMRSGRITGVPCRGQVTITEMEWQPGSIDVTLLSAKAQSNTLEFPYDIGAAELVEGEASVAKAAGRNDCLEIVLAAGKATRLRVMAARA
jgi:alpha-L-fucosidase 2